MNAEQFNASWGPDPIPDLTEPGVVGGDEGRPTVAVTFTTDLGADRPDVDLFRVMANYLEERPERLLIAMTIAYVTEPDCDNGLLVGELILGDVINLAGGDA